MTLSLRQVSDRLGLDIEQIKTLCMYKMDSLKDTYKMITNALYIQEDDILDMYCESVSDSVSLLYLYFIFIVLARFVDSWTGGVSCWPQNPRQWEEPLRQVRQDIDQLPVGVTFEGVQVRSQIPRHVHEERRRLLQMHLLLGDW